MWCLSVNVKLTYEYRLWTCNLHKPNVQIEKVSLLDVYKFFDIVVLMYSGFWLILAVQGT